MGKFSFLLICSLDCCTFIIGRTTTADIATATNTAVAKIQSIAAAAATAVVNDVMIVHDCFQHGYYLRLDCFPYDPSADNRLNVKPISFSSIPSFSYGYQSRVCFYIHGQKTSNYRRQEFGSFLCKLALHLGYGITRHKGAIKPLLQSIFLLD